MRHILILLFIAVNVNAEIKMNDECGMQTNVAKESRLFNNIKWKTASEQENFGYDIYRADSEEGEYKIVNEDTLEGAGTTVDESKYEFHDDNIDPCEIYYYYIESIAMNGTREAFTPKFPSKRKLQPK